MTTTDRTTMRWADQQAEGGPPGREGSGAPRGGPRDTGPVDWQERFALRNWTLPVKLAAVLLVPTLFVVSLGVLRIVEQTQKATSYDSVQQAVSLEDRAARLMGDLAAERTAAGVFVASGRDGDPGALRRSMDASRASANDLREAANSADSLDPQTRSSYDDAAAGVRQLDTLRREVLGGRIDTAAVAGRYTDEVTALLDFGRSLTREAADPSVAGLASGLYSLSVVREEDSFVQAAVASGIAAGRIDAPSIDQARNATLRRTIAVDDFRAAVGNDNAPLADAVVGPDVDRRDVLAQVVLGRGSAGLPLQVAGPEWERASSAVTVRDTQTSEQLRTRLQTSAAALQDGARNAAGIASVVLLLALIAGAAVVFFVTRSLLRPLRLLRRSALDVAERRLPGAVRSLREGEAPDTDIAPTPIQTREEIGQVARAFDQVHAQAVRLAAEQAGLRSAFNAIFVNLSRRSQALVERQLRLIEQLENNEEDPDALSNLFQLDHLATRMRRNSENLLVLSGTDLSRRGSRPVPAIDVLRAAASEVEQYQRIDIAPPPHVMLLGRTASDVVHLVAELLENATTFSAPETRVDVTVTQAPDGGLRVDIADAGVGMTQEDMRDANQRLASPPTVDVSASRRMGLFVVGRLATRHGIAVSLRTREPAGLVASVAVPANAILAAMPGGGRPGAASTPGAAALAGGAAGAAGAAVAAGTRRGEGAPGQIGTGPGGDGGSGGDGGDGPAIPSQERSNGRPALPQRGSAGTGATSFFDPGTPSEETAAEPGTNGVTPTNGTTPGSGAGSGEGDLPRRGPRSGGMGALPTRNGRRMPPPVTGGPGGPAGPAGSEPADGADADDGGPETMAGQEARPDPSDAPARGSLAPVEEVPPPSPDAADDASEEGDEDDDRVATSGSADAGDDAVTVWRAPGGPAPAGEEPAADESADTGSDSRRPAKGAVAGAAAAVAGAAAAAVGAATGKRGTDDEKAEDEGGQDDEAAGGRSTGRHGWRSTPPGGEQVPSSRSPQHGWHTPDGPPQGPGPQDAPPQGPGPQRPGPPQGRPPYPPPPGWGPPGRGGPPPGWRGPVPPGQGPVPPGYGPPSGGPGQRPAGPPWAAPGAGAPDQHGQRTDEGAATGAPAAEQPATASAPADTQAEGEEATSAAPSTDAAPDTEAPATGTADAAPTTGADETREAKSTRRPRAMPLTVKRGGSTMRPRTSPTSGAGPDAAPETSAAESTAAETPAADGPGTTAAAAETGTATPGTTSTAGPGPGVRPSITPAAWAAGAAGAAAGAGAAAAFGRRGEDQAPADRPADEQAPQQASAQQASAQQASAQQASAQQAPGGQAPDQQASDEEAPEQPASPAQPAGGDDAGGTPLPGRAADHGSALPRRRGPSGAPSAMPGQRPGGARPAGDEGLFAPTGDGQNGAHPNGNGNGANGAPARPGPNGSPPRAVPERLPLRAGTAGRERTPIFDEVASVWFRESSPQDEAAEDWQTSGDAGWRAAAASTEAADGGTTEAGLPRRRPRARLVPGAAGSGAGEAGAATGTARPAAGDTARAAAAPAGGSEPAPSGTTAAGRRRSADAIRGRLASYQRGVNEGRSGSRPRPDNGDASGGRSGDEEDQ